MPANPTEQPIDKWKIKLINISARKSPLDFGILVDLDNRILDFKTSFRPAATFLYFHFVRSLLVNKKDKVNDCDQYIQTLSTKRSFNTPDSWMRNLMLLMLAKIVGDVDPNNLAFCLKRFNFYCTY